jgi:hypothetical protein
VSELPPFFARGWSFTLRLSVWRVELRNQGRDGVPNVPCRLMHFHSRPGDCVEAETGRQLADHGVTAVTGFLSDPTWSFAARRRRGEPDAAPTTLGHISVSDADGLGWTIETADAAEFETLWRMVERSEGEGAGLAIFLFGHAAVAVEGDRGETHQVAPIRMYRLMIDHGGFPERL